MKRIAVYAVFLALLVFTLKVVEYHLLLARLPKEFYIFLIAMMFTTLGVWAGFRLTSPKRVVTSVSATTFQVNEAGLAASGISMRELEVLQLIRQGLSNQEIADQLSLSLNTVKTHISSLFIKLDVKRRTQAIQKAKEWGLVE